MVRPTLSCTSYVPSVAHCLSYLCLSFPTYKMAIIMVPAWDFPGSLVVKTPGFHCSGHRFDPWSRN